MITRTCVCGHNRRRHPYEGRRPPPTSSNKIGDDVPCNVRGCWCLDFMVP